MKFSVPRERKERRKRDEKVSILPPVEFVFPLAACVQDKGLMGSCYCLFSPSTRSSLCGIAHSKMASASFLGLVLMFTVQRTKRLQSQCLLQAPCGWVGPDHRPPACHHCSRSSLVSQQAGSGRDSGAAPAARASTHCLPSLPLFILYPVPGLILQLGAHKNIDAVSVSLAVSLDVEE